MKNNIWSILCLLALLVILIVNIQMCSNPEIVTETQTQTIYETVYDSVDRIVYRDRLVPKYINQSDTIIQIDSVFCTQLATDYYSTVGYSDTLQDDSLAFIALQFEVYKNRAQCLTHTYRDRTPTEFITTTTTINNIIADRPRFKFYAGPMVTYVKGNAPGVGGGVLLSSKTFAAGYSYDVTNQTNYLQMYFSIIKGSKGN